MSSFHFHTTSDAAFFSCGKDHQQTSLAFDGSAAGPPALSKEHFDNGELCRRIDDKSFKAQTNRRFDRLTRMVRSRHVMPQQHVVVRRKKDEVLEAAGSTSRARQKPTARTPVQTGDISEAAGRGAGKPAAPNAYEVYHQFLPRPT